MVDEAPPAGFTVNPDDLSAQASQDDAPPPGFTVNPDAAPQTAPTLVDKLSPVSGVAHLQAMWGNDAGAPREAESPKTDVGEWVGNKVDNAAAGVLNTVPRAVSLGSWQPFKPEPASPGAQRFSKDIEDLTGETEQKNLTPAQLAAEKESHPLGAILDPIYSSPIAQRAAQEVMDLGAVAGGVEGLARTPELPAEVAPITPKPNTSYAQKVGEEEPAAQPIAAPAAQPASRQSIGSAQVNQSPFNLTGQETGRGSPSFPQVKLAKNAGDVPADEQATRASIVGEVLDDAGADDAGIRNGVITGNEQTLRNEYQAAKNPNQNPANAVMAGQISAEQNALPKFAQQRIDATGADPTLTNDYQRGETINNAFYGDGSLNDYFKQQKQKIYQAALDKNGSTQIGTPTTDALLTDPQFTAGAGLRKHEGVVSSASNLLDLAKNVGFRDPITGVQYAPGSVASYNAVTKALNQGWTHDTAPTIGKINDAINQDIAASGGGDLYSLGNSIHQLHKSLMSDSPGINKVFGAVDPNGIQTAKPFDTIPQTLNDMPLDQWRHIHDTLDTVSRGQLRGAPAGMDPIPSDLQAAAANAKAEMEGSLAREVYAQGANKAGAWNSNGANKALNGRVGQKILDTFSPDEVRKFQVLNAAGEMMPGAHPYEGAGAQTARMAAEPGFIEKYAPKAGALLGAKAAGPPGVFLGENLGNKVQGFTKARREAAQAANLQQALRTNRGVTPPVVAPVTRATGGRVSHDVLVSRLMSRWKAARRDANKTTEPLLNQSDATITKALKIAQAQPMT